MIEPEHPQLSMAAVRTGLDQPVGVLHGPTGETPLNLELMRLIDAQFLETPWYGGGRWRVISGARVRVGRKRVRRLMAKMGLAPIYQRPRTTVPHPEHRVYPYLLRDLAIDRPDQVWCADITYMPMRRGFLYLVAIMDWASAQGAVLAGVEHDGRGVLPGGAGGGAGAVGRPEIFNTDQGSQFTSPRFTGVLQEAGVRISMDGRGRWMDNVFIERLWRSLKYECVYLHAFETGSGARAGLGGGSTITMPAAPFDPGRTNAPRSPCRRRREGLAA